MAELLYASWGGSGRTATLRAAMERASESDSPLLYLAILDRDAFGDLDEAMTDVAEQELEWLLGAAVDLVREQIGQPELPARVIVSHGDVLDAIAEIVRVADVGEIVIGSPVRPFADVTTADEVAAAIADRSGRRTAVL